MMRFWYGLFVWMFAPLRFWQAAIPAIIGAVGAVGGGLLAKKGQSDANRMNYRIAQEQMAFQERMSNTAYRRAVLDLKGAGLNPMLAYQQGGASSPPGASATMENENAQLGQAVANSAQNAAALAQASADVRVKTAAARKTNAEAAMIEAEIPYSAGSAQVRFQKLNEEFAKLVNEAEKSGYERALKAREYDKLQPLVVEYQRLLNKMMDLDMSEAEARSRMFKEYPAMKWLEQVSKILGFSSHSRIGPR